MKKRFVSCVCKMNDVVCKHQFITLFCLFTACFLIWGIIADYDKIIPVYPDELRYFEIAKSIANGDGIQIYNADSGFQKILYSLILVPAFLFKNSFVQVRVIAWINSAVLASSVFPIYLLSKEILNNKKWTWIITLFTVTMPAFVNTNYFMSENIFFSLSIWMMYVFWKIFSTESRKKVIYSAIGGILSYLAYLNKEIALYFILAYLAAELICGIINKDLKKSIPSILALFGTFVFLFLLFKLTLFSGTGNSYDQMGLSVLFEKGRFLYFLYALITDAVFIILSLFFYPIIITSLFNKEIKNHKFKFAVFSVLCVMVACIAIAYTITVREDFPLLSPRIHTRYIEALTIPLIIMMVDALNGSGKLNEHPIIQKILIGITLGYSVILLLFTEGISLEGCHVDTLSLKYVQGLIYVFNKTALFGTHTVKILITIVIFILLYLLIRSTKKFLAAFFTFAVLVNIASIGIAQLSAFSAYQLRIERNVVENANNKLNSLEGNILIFAYEYWDYGVIDAYFTRETYKTTVQIVKLNTDLSDFEINLSSDNITAAVPSEHPVYPDLKSVDYILWQNEIQVKQCISLKKDSVTVVDDFYFPEFTLYKNNDNSKILFEDFHVFPTEVGNSTEITSSNQQFLYSACKASDGKYISTQANQAVFYGPYSNCKAGKYRFTVKLNFNQPVTLDRDVIKMSFGSTADNIEYTELFKYEGNDTFVFEAELPTESNTAEIRCFSNAAGIEFISLIIERVE